MKTKEISLKSYNNYPRNVSNIVYKKAYIEIFSEN